MKIFAQKKELNSKLIDGINKLADNVSATLGPKGRNVILQSGDQMIITKDGVTVAKFVDLEDPFENLGAQLVRQAAIQANEVAGDGTTTTTVLTRALVEDASQQLKKGVSPIELKNSLEKALEEVVGYLKFNSTKIRSFDDVKNISTVSANNDVLVGEIVAKAVDLSGKDGAITLLDAKNSKTSLELVEGFRFSGGYHSQEFINDKKKGSVFHEDALIFITNIKLSKLNQILSILSYAATQKRPLIIVAPEIYDEALAALIANSFRGNMKVAAIKPGSFGEEQRGILKDLAIATGGKFCTVDNVEFGSNDEIGFSPADFGICKKIESFKGRTTILGGAGEQDQIDERIDELKIEIKHTEDLAEAERIQKRITRLSSGIAIIKIGGYSDLEVNETRHRIVDALEAIACSQKDGMLPGGGVSLLRSAKWLKDSFINSSQIPQSELCGYELLYSVLFRPFEVIAANSGENVKYLQEKIFSNESNFDYGYNFKNNSFENLIDSGIVDPVKVTETALRTSVSVASTILLTNHAIIEL